MFQATRSTTTPGRTALVLLAVLSLLLSLFALTAPPVLADGSGSPTNCDTAVNLDVDASGTDTYTSDSVVYAPAGQVVTGLCIKSGNDSFGVDSKHSQLITADGVYGVGGCYTVAGIGTGSVTITRTLRSDCNGISHIDIVQVAATPDVSVTKTTSADPVSAGGNFNYVFQVITSGTGSSANVQLSDPLPDAFTYGTPVITGGDTGDVCSTTGGVLSCQFGTVASGTTITVTLPATTDAADCGEPIANTATVSSTVNTNANNNTATADVTVVCEEEPETGDIKVIKRLCTDIGENNVCNGREDEFDGWEIDFEVFEGTDIEADPIGTITVTLDEGSGSQGQSTDDLGGILEAGETYTVCEVPVLRDPETDDEVELIAVPRPDETTGGVNQSEHEDGPCIIVELNPGTNVVQFLDLVDEEEEPELGTITIIKDASPNAAQDFIFTAGEGLSGFTLDDDSDGTLSNSELFEDLEAGEYSVAESTVEGWTLTSITCNEGANFEIDETNARQVNITLDEGEDVTCTFLNTQNVVQPQTGSITIVKDTVPNGAQNFSFTTTGPTPAGLGVFDLDDDSEGSLPNSRAFTNLAPGVYTVTEVRNGDYTVSINCSTGGSGNERVATITLVAGASVTCTFVNTLITVPPTPTLAIVKVASTETITITGPAGALVASPSSVTWTLTYTLTNGPVHGAVITDPIPTGFTFVEASNGGTLVGNTVTWNLGTLTASGSVTFTTTVNPVTVARGTVTNTATIDSNETAPANGQDSVTVSQTGTQGSVSTPAPTPVVRTGTATSTGVPNTATSADAGLTAAAMLGALMLLSAGVFVSAAMGGGRRRR